MLGNELAACVPPSCYEGQEGSCFGLTPTSSFASCAPTDEIYVFDSLVLTVIVGDAQANIKSHFAKEVYQNDIKGRQAMADAVYATSLARKDETDLNLRSCSQLRHGNRKGLGQQVDTVWNAHGQAKFERAKLGLPIACLVDYAGLAVLVEPLLPLK